VSGGLVSGALQTTRPPDYLNGYMEKDDGTSSFYCRQKK